MAAIPAKSSAVRSGHPSLGRKAQNFAKKGLAPGLVEMGGHLVEQDERGGAFELGNQLGLGQNEPQQERLLLARGAGFGERFVGAVHHY